MFLKIIYKQSLQKHFFKNNFFKVTFINDYSVKKIDIKLFLQMNNVNKKSMNCTKQFYILNNNMK